MGSSFLEGMNCPLEALKSGLSPLKKRLPSISMADRLVVLISLNVIKGRYLTTLVDVLTILG